jgi:dTDP-4-amino-4,6-dideoxygalactose transaminase
MTETPRAAMLSAQLARLDDANRARRRAIAEQAAEQILSLPMSPIFTDAQVDRVREVLWAGSR